MDIAELSGKFLVDDEISSQTLGQLIHDLLPYCRVHKNGTVELIAQGLSGLEQVKLVLAARLVASKLDGATMSDELSAEEIGEFTGLPKNQAAARAKDSVDMRFSERSARGRYRARRERLAGFLSELSAKDLAKVVR